MGKRHLKTLVAPETYSLKEKKNIKYLLRHAPGPHPIKSSITITQLIKDQKLAKTKREINRILQQKEIKIDNRRIKDTHFPIGLMDTITIPGVGDYRMSLNKKGKMHIKEDKNTQIKPTRIIGKRTIQKGKTQINLEDGRNILTDNKELKPGDTLIIELPTQKIKEHLKLKEGAHITLLEGKHKGDTGTVQKIEKEKLIYKDKEGNTIETLKKYAFVSKEEFTRWTQCKKSK